MATRAQHSPRRFSLLKRFVGAVVIPFIELLERIPPMVALCLQCLGALVFLYAAVCFIAVGGLLGTAK